MKKLIPIFALLTCTVSVSGLDFPKLSSPKKKVIALPEGNSEVNIITLTEKNSLVFRGVVDAESVSDVQTKAFQLSSDNKYGDSIYLFLDTPGGSVVAGQELISSLKALPQEVKTITNFAASMGFIMAQTLGERLILPHGTLMSHRAKGGAQGQIPGELNTRVEYWTKRVDNIDKECAKRMNMKVEDYKKMILNEYWIDGQDAVLAQAADKVVLVKCDSDLLNGTIVQNIKTFFGEVSLTWSSCPLITNPLKIDFGRISPSISQLELQTLKSIFYSLVYNKTEFMNKYLNTGIYNTYVK